MATVGSDLLPLIELSRRMDPNGSPAAILELLAKRIPLLSFLLFREGNTPNGHEATVRTGLPDSYWRIVNRGVKASYGTTGKIMETCGERMGKSEMDIKAAQHGGNLHANRLFEAKGHMLSVGHGIDEGLWYGNSTIAPEQPNGIMLRMSDLGAGNANQIVDAGGDEADNTSIVLLKTGEGLFGIYPQGSEAGLIHTDEGLTTLFDKDDATKSFPGYREYFTQRAGTMLRDWRCAARAANIDVSDLQANGDAAPFLLDLMTMLSHRVEGFYEGDSDGAFAYFMNPTTFEMLDIQRQDRVRAGGGVTWENVDGVMVPTYRRRRIYVTDSILDSEERVV